LFGFRQHAGRLVESCFRGMEISKTDAIVEIVGELFRLLFELRYGPAPKCIGVFLSAQGPEAIDGAGGLTRVELDEAGEVRERLVPLLQVGMGDGPRVPAPDVSRVQLQSLGEVGDD